MADVSDKWIKFNYWYLNNRKDLTRWWVIVLLGIDLILIAFVLINGVAAAITYNRSNEWISEMGESRVLGTSVMSRNAPENFTVSTVETVVDARGQTIFLGIFSNPNSFWSAPTVSYKFVTSNGETDIRETSIPAEGERAVILGKDTDGVTSQAAIEFESIDWERTPQISLPQVPVSFTPAEHKFATVQGNAGLQAVSQVATTVSNDSLYKIRNMKVVVVVRNGSTLVGARQFFVEDLESRESRDLNLQFPDALGRFTDIGIYPEVNILDDQNLEI